MEKINITIETENASFSPMDEENATEAEVAAAKGEEAARILRELADKLEARGASTDTEIYCSDLNGNKVGKLTTQ